MSKLKAKDPTEAEPSKPKIVVYGDPGAGKTWFSLDFPSCYYIDTEGGANLPHYTAKLKKSGGVYLGPKDGALDFDTIIEQVQALATEKHGFKTLVIDSISKVFNSAIATEAEKLGAKDAFGASKKPAVAKIRRLINWLDRIDMNVILIAHEKTEWGQGPNGDRVEIGKTFDCWDKLEYELHLCLRADKSGPQRTFKVRKSRLIGFPTNDVFALDYLEFAKRYGKDIIEAEVKQLVLASPDQVAELERLTNVLRTDEDEIAKLYTKAGVEHWRELSRDSADKAIAYFKKKLN